MKHGTITNANDGTTVQFDWDNDPCARAAALRQALYSLVQGTQAYAITYKANGIERTVSYSVIKIETLQQLIRTAEDECAALTGLPARSRRVAIQFGARRTFNTSGE